MKSVTINPWTRLQIEHKPKQPNYTLMRDYAMKIRHRSEYGILEECRREFLYETVKKRNMKYAKERAPTMITQSIIDRAMNGDAWEIAKIISHYEFGSESETTEGIFVNLGWLFFARLLGVEDEVYENFARQNIEDYSEGQEKYFIIYIKKIEENAVANSPNSSLLQRARKFGANLMKAYSSGGSSPLPKF